MTAAIINTAFGLMSVEIGDGQITALRFVENKLLLTQSEVDLEREEDKQVLADLKVWLTAYEKGDRERLNDLPHVSLSGTAFQKAVWKATTEVAPGETRTYGELARKVEDGFRASGRDVRVIARSVGTALSKNPILLLVPCHRIVGRDKQLTGYSGGLEKKAKLLEHEIEVFGRKDRLTDSLFG